MDQYFCTNSSWKEKKSRCWTSASILIPSGGSPVDSKKLSNVKAQTMHVEVVGLQNKMFTAKEYSGWRNIIIIIIITMMGFHLSRLIYFLKSSWQHSKNTIEGSFCSWCPVLPAGGGW